MSKNLRNRIVATLLFTAILLVSFLRQNAMLVLNGALTGNSSYKAYMVIPDYLLQINPGGIMAIKWAVTILVALITLLFNIKILDVLFQKGIFRIQTIGLYGFFALLSMFLFLFNLEFGLNLYPVARNMLGLIQGPILPMVTIVYVWSNYYPRFRNQK